MEDDLIYPFGASRHEKRLLEGMPGDAQTLLLQQIKLIALREVRALKELEELKVRDNGREDSKPLDDLTVKDCSARGKAAMDSEQISSERTVKRKSAFEAQQQLEGQLHKLHEQKFKAIELLARLEERQAPQQDESKFRIYIPDNGRGKPSEAGTAAAGNCDIRCDDIEGADEACGRAQCAE